MNKYHSRLTKPNHAKENNGKLDRSQNATIWSQSGALHSFSAQVSFRRGKTPPIYVTATYLCQITDGLYNLHYVTQLVLGLGGMTVYTVRRNVSTGRDLAIPFNRGILFISFFSWLMFSLIICFFIALF